MTRADIEGRSDKWFDRLRHEIYQGRYAPSPARWADVPKASGLPASTAPGGDRRLGILLLRDRVVHAALKQVPEPIFQAPAGPGRPTGGRESAPEEQAAFENAGAGGWMKAPPPTGLHSRSVASCRSPPFAFPPPVAGSSTASLICSTTSSRVL